MPPPPQAAAAGYCSLYPGEFKPRRLLHTAGYTCLARQIHRPYAPSTEPRGRAAHLPEGGKKEFGRAVEEDEGLRKTIAATAVAVLTLSAVGASAQGVRTEEEVWAIPPGGCPSTGYTKPLFGHFGPNGDAQMGYEIAGSCIGLDVRKAAIAIGMGRYVPIGVKNVSSVMFVSEGRLGSLPNAKVKTHMSYVVPGMRMQIEGGPTKQIHVFAEKVAWDESEPGMGHKPGPAGALAEREALLKLTPHGAFWSVVDAEGNAKISKVRGKMVISATSPYDRIPVTITFNADLRPENVKFTYNGHRYEANFYDYSEHWDTGKSPNYLVWFPSRMVWTMDGRPLADLKTTDFKSNAYVVFPRPITIAAAQ